MTATIPEIWRPVPGYEGLYEVSSRGRVRSLERKVRSPYGTRTIRQRLLKHVMRGRDALAAVSLSKGCTVMQVYVHTLQRQVFADGEVVS